MTTNGIEATVSKVEHDFDYSSLDEHDEHDVEG